MSDNSIFFAEDFVTGGFRDSSTFRRRGATRPSFESPASKRLMAAGVDLFCEFGFLATTIRAITGSCGLTPPAFYNHFDSKESFLYAIISDSNAVLEHRLDELTLDSSDPSTALRSLVQTLVQFNLNWPKEAKVANREYIFLEGALRDEVIDHRRRVRSLFESVLSAPGLPGGLLGDSTSYGDLHMEPRLLAISIVNLCISSSDWYRKDGPLSMDAVIDACCRLSLRMALAEDERDPSLAR